MGLRPTAFSHYTFNAGENKGEPVTFLSKSELSRSLNVRQTGKGLEPREGSKVTNLDINDYPDPLAGNTPIKSGFGFSYGTTVTNIELFAADEFIYKNSVSPTVLTSGLDPSAKFQFQKAADLAYMTNNVDPVRFYQPGRSTAVTYPAGYDTPAAFTAADTGVGVLAAGTYEYYVTLYDLTTLTESNRQVAAVSVVTGANRENTLSNLPIDPDDRTTHWRIYRKDPSGYYHYDLIQIDYDAGSPSYIDNIAATGTRRIAPINNFKPNVSKTICLHTPDKVMIYASGNSYYWSKPYQYQDVPTENSDILEDDSNEITKAVSFSNAVIFFKSRSIYVVSGDFTKGILSTKRISATVGTLSPDSVCTTPQGVFFFGSDGKPRLITPTDFQTEDLRDETDIAYKYSEKFQLIDPSQYPIVHAVLYNYRRATEYRIFVPIDANSDFCNQAFVFDYGLAKRNGGDSAWFTYEYNINAMCSFISFQSGGVIQIQAGDDYGLIWRLDSTSEYFDGDEFLRFEDDGDVTFGANTVDISTAAMGVNQYQGMQLILYDAFTFDVIFRSKILSNTVTEFTTQDAIPSLPTTNPFITVGGYLTYFASADYTHNRAGRCRPEVASLLLGESVGEHTVFFFINYDMNESFNYNYDYFNNPDNPSRTPRSDVYELAVGTSLSTYDASTYGTGHYGSYLYKTAEFPLNNKYLFNHANFGIITREPSTPFLYLGSSIFYQYKGLQRPNL